MTDKILVFTTCASAEEAQAIAEAAIDRRLAACASLGAPVESVYIWRGERQREREHPLTLKTRADRFDALAAEIRRLHSYENPEIVAVAVSAASPAYLSWIDEVLG